MANTLPDIIGFDTDIQLTSRPSRTWIIDRQTMQKEINQIIAQIDSNAYVEYNGKKLLEGYEAANSVTIIVDDLKLVGKVIDAALNHGANHVDSLNFGLRNKTAYQDEALRLAVLDAKRKAEIVAATLGKSILSVRNVSINSNRVSAPQNYKMVRAMAATEDAVAYETPIESGNLQCSASVHVEFEISR